MKKVLIVNYYHHKKIGGIETYTKKLIDLFLKNNLLIFELSLYEKNNLFSKFNENYYFIYNKYSKFFFKYKNKKSILYFFYYLYFVIKSNAFIKKVIKKNKIDVVVQNTFCTPKIKFDKNTKYIWVQHMDWKSENFLRKVSKKIFKIKDNFEFPSIVVYTKNDISFLIENKLVKKATNLVAIVPSVVDWNNTKHLMSQQENNLLVKKDKVTFIGRLQNEHKNIDFLNKIVNQSKKIHRRVEIHVYGDGQDKHLIENNPNIIMHGPFNNANIKEILFKTKLLLVPSNYEGFGLVIVEALSHGVPCIIANTFLNASFLIDDSRGKLMNNFDPQAWVDAINEIMNLSDNDYQKLSNNCLQFAKENLSLEQFNEKWLELIEN